MVGTGEPRALQQIRNIASLSVVEGIAVMPDYHYGIGATVGSVIALRGAVIPSAVGVDIGCGMMAVRTRLSSHDLPENLGPLRSSLEKTIPHGRDVRGKRSTDRGSWDKREPPDLVHRQWLRIEKGFDSLKNRFEPIEKWLRRRHPVSQLGSLGTGNHFIELCLDETDRVWIMLHSGSRGIGNAIGRYFIDRAKKDMAGVLGSLPDGDCAYLKKGTRNFDDYVEAVSWAQNYAGLNRQCMMDLVIGVLTENFRAFKTDEVAVSCHHNYIDFSRKGLIVTRKGAVSAAKGEMGIIPGSMGTRSHIVEGLGNEASYCSCSHGAGRTMSRTRARKTISFRNHTADTEGVDCRKDHGVLDESPRAYKDIDRVMASQDDLVRIRHTLKQILCVKG